MFLCSSEKRHVPLSLSLFASLSLAAIVIVIIVLENQLPLRRDSMNNGTAMPVDRTYYTGYWFGVVLGVEVILLLLTMLFSRSCCVSISVIVSSFVAGLSSLAIALSVLEAYWITGSSELIEVTKPYYYTIAALSALSFLVNMIYSITSSCYLSACNKDDSTEEVY